MYTHTMYVCMHIYIYIYTYICMYVYIYIYIHVYVYVYMHMLVLSRGTAWSSATTIGVKGAVSLGTKILILPEVILIHQK